jgi:hypothetical protein
MERHAKCAASAHEISPAAGGAGGGIECAVAQSGVAGLATMFYPPLKIVIGSITTSAAITVGGLALIILPTVIVGNEILIMSGVAAAVGLWFLAHRHGQLRGVVDAAEKSANIESK